VAAAFGRDDLGQVMPDRVVGPPVGERAVVAVRRRPVERGEHDRTADARLDAPGPLAHAHDQVARDDLGVRPQRRRRQQHRREQ
jgi:hypothetical protein